MKSQSLPFKAPMVRAALDDSKAQTRRMINRLKGFGKITEFQPATTKGYDWTFRDRRALWNEIRHDYLMERCPYGKPGDRLWVREEHYLFGDWVPVPGVQTKGGRRKWRFVNCGDIMLFDPPAFFRTSRNSKEPYEPAWHKRLARFMPRKYSRITLEIVNIRVERLNDISEEDAMAEGVEPLDFERYDERDESVCPECGGTGLVMGLGPNYGVIFDVDCRDCDTHKKRFKHLWADINGPGSWEANPLVWVIEFKRVEGGAA